MAKIKFQTGNREAKTNRLVVTNPYDKRLQMYQDSLALYNTFAGTNPIEINNTLLESHSKDIKKNPSRNYASIPKGGGPWGSALGKVKKVKTPPLNVNKALDTNFPNSPSVYAGIVNSGIGDPNNYISQLGMGQVPDLIRQDEYQKAKNKKRDFAPIGYQSLPYQDPNFVGDKFTTINNKLVERTSKIENYITPQQVRAVYPNITDKELNDIISRKTHPAAKNYGILDKNNKIQYVDNRKNRNAVGQEAIDFKNKESYITTPIYAKPKREVILGGKDPEPEPTRPEPTKIDKIEPKQASFSFTPPEDNRKPKMVPTSQFVNPEGSPSLSYPAMNQGFFGRMKSKITGKNPMPYWEDKTGVKRYPHLGENNPEQVKQIRLLKGNLDRKVPEEAAELKRIDKLLANPALRNKMATSYQNGVKKTNVNFRNKYQLGEESVPAKQNVKLSEKEKIDIGEKERQKMLDYMKHPSYKERLKKEMFGDLYEESRRGQNRAVDREYERRLKEMGNISIERPDFDLSVGEMVAAGTYVPQWAVSDMDMYSPYRRQKKSTIYISEDPQLEDLHTNSDLYGQVIGHELGHSSHEAKVGGNTGLFTKKPFFSPLQFKLYQHSDRPEIRQKQAVFDLMEPYFPRYSKKGKKEVYDLAEKRLGPGKAEELYQEMTNFRNKGKELVKKYKKEYDHEKHGPEIPEMLKSYMIDKNMFDYLNDNATEVGTRMIGLRKLASEKFGHDMNEDFDIRKYKDQIQNYFKEKGLLNEYEHLSKDLELTDDQINDMMKYIAKSSTKSNEYQAKKGVKFVKNKYQEGTREANSYTFGKEPGVGRAIGKVLTGFADDKGKGYSISPSEVMKNLAMPASLLSGCTVDKRVGYHPQRNPNARPSGKAGCRPPKNPGYMNSIRR